MFFKKITKSFYTKEKKNLFLLLKNSTFLSLPSILGIILALLAIPIHLKINGKSDYGNFIFFHFIIFFGLLLNFGINKIVAIEIAKNKSRYEIITESIKLSILVSLLVIFIGLVSSIYLENFLYFFKITIGLSITILYLTLEGILQGLKKFKSLSIINFIFYTVSLNIPSITLLFKNNSFEILITLSILIKFVAILVALFLLKNFLKKNYNSNFNFFKKIKKYSKWYFLYNVNTQIFEILDKYLIKIFIGSSALALYSIPYQLAGKITIFSKSISAVLLPEISRGNKTERENFNQSLNFYTFSVPIILLVIFPFLDELLIFWLREEFSKEILSLTKIFLIITWISGISHILITYFEGKKKIKFNTLIELYLILPFLLAILIVVFNSKNLIYISSVLLIKEIILFVFRTQKIRNKIEDIMLIYSIIILVIINLIINLNFDNYFKFSFLILLILSSYLILIKNKK